MADNGNPHIKVIKGNPTDDELAALISVLAAATGTTPEPGPSDVDLWGHPVDQLRYHVASWQKVTLTERTHLRR